MALIGRGSEYLETGPRYVHTTDIHGRPRTVEVKTCDSDCECGCNSSGSLDGVDYIG